MSDPTAAPTEKTLADLLEENARQLARWRDMEKIACFKHLHPLCERLERELKDCRFSFPGGKHYNGVHRLRFMCRNFPNIRIASDADARIVAVIDWSSERERVNGLPWRIQFPDICHYTLTPDNRYRETEQGIVEALLSVLSEYFIFPDESDEVGVGRLRNFRECPA